MFDNFRAKFRNYFTKPTATPEPLEDAFNNVTPVSPDYQERVNDFYAAMTNSKTRTAEQLNGQTPYVIRSYESCLDFADRMVHEELTDIRLHLQDMVAHEHATPKRPRILSKLQHTLDEVTHKLLEHENRMHRHGIAK